MTRCACGTEPVAGDAFCRSCGARLPTPPAAPTGIAGAGRHQPLAEADAVEAGQTLGGSVIHGGQGGVTVTQSTTDVGGIKIELAGGPAAPAVQYCPICDRAIRPDDIHHFRCRECGRAPICLQHRVNEHRCCEECAKAKGWPSGPSRASEPAQPAGPARPPQTEAAEARGVAAVVCRPLFQVYFPPALRQKYDQFLSQFGQGESYEGWREGSFDGGKPKDSWGSGSFRKIGTDQVGSFAEAGEGIYRIELFTREQGKYFVIAYEKQGAAFAHHWGTNDLEYARRHPNVFRQVR